MRIARETGTNILASMGPGRKPRKEPLHRATPGPVVQASMGPGRKPRKERLGQVAGDGHRQRFNGAWAKTQEGTRRRTPGAPRTAWGFNGAWAKTQEGTQASGS